MNRWLWLLALLLGAAPLRAQEGRESITQVMVQRTRCFGPCPIDRLVLNADGSAQYVGEGGTPRLGHFSGAVGKENFARLAAWIERAGFRDLKEELGEGNPDTPDLIITVVRGGLFRTVVFHPLRQSPLGWEMATMARGAASEIEWRKDEAASASGIRGSVERTILASERTDASYLDPKLETVAMPFVVVLARPERRFEPGLTAPDQPFTCVADQQGSFSFLLPPGKYQLSVLSLPFRITRPVQEWRRWLASSQLVEVTAGKFSPATLLFETKAPTPAKK